MLTSDGKQKIVLLRFQILAQEPLPTEISALKKTAAKGSGMEIFVRMQFVRKEYFNRDANINFPVVCR
jgi:hypothetical protein